jgi:outer membrane protein assembly factor BamB
VGSKDGYLYALEIASGQMRWKTRVGQVITAPPVAGESVVYIQSGGTYALDRATGKVLWRAGLGGSVQTAPVLSGQFVYVASVGDEVYALE